MCVNESGTRLRIPVAARRRSIQTSPGNCHSGEATRHPAGTRVGTTQKLSVATLEAKTFVVLASGKGIFVETRMKNRAKLNTEKKAKRKAMKQSKCFPIVAAMLLGAGLTTATVNAQNECEDRITSGGWIVTDFGTANFGASGGLHKGQFWGQLNYVD